MEPSSGLSRRTFLSAAGVAVAASAVPWLLPGGAAAATPQANLAALADLRFGMFNHFNMGTFTDEEWATPNQDPRRFAPTAVNCAQWAAAAAAAKMTFGVLTTKTGSAGSRSTSTAARLRTGRTSTSGSTTGRPSSSGS